VGVKGGQGLNGLGVDPRVLIQRLASLSMMDTAAPAVADDVMELRQKKL
jgi:hypothetical protein